MRILFWSEGFWPRVGGIETQALELVLELQQRGHHILVMAQDDGVNISYPGLDIKRFDFLSLISKPNFELIIALKRAVKDFQPDCVHLFTITGGCGLAYLLTKPNAPLITTFHAPLRHPIIKEFEKLSNTICCVSKWIAEELGKLD